MKTRNIILAIAAVLLISACTNATDGPKSFDQLESGKVYTFTASAGDMISTKAYFKDDEAPSRWIYWDNEDAFDFHDVTMLSGASWTLAKTSGAPKQIAADARSLMFEKEASDYLVITYPAGAVEIPDSLEVKTWISSKLTELDTLPDFSVVKVKVNREQMLSSVLTPDELPMTTARIAVSESAKNLVQQGKDTISVLHDGSPLKIYPLAGIARMTVKGLGVDAATITKVNILTEFKTTSSSTGTEQRGLRGDNVFSLKDDMPIVGNWESGDSRFDLTLSGGEGIAYTADKGADVVFVVDESIDGLKTLQVVLYTADGAVYKKKFEMLKDGEPVVMFNRARISSFTLDFTDGTVVKAADSKFSVEWAQGYLIYDEQNQGYKIGAPEDNGLYFKFGTATGFKFFKDNADWAWRLQPKDENGNKLSGSTTFLPNGTTLYNGTEMFYSGVLLKDVRMYGENALWQDTPYFYEDGGKIVAGTVAGGSEGDEYKYHAINGTTSFDGANDPCSYVKVAEGEKRWRLPSKAEAEELVALAGPGMEFFTEDGSDVKGSSGNGSPVYARLGDGSSNLVFKALGNVTQSFSAKYTQIQLTFGNKYAVNFWTTEYEGKQEPQKSTTNSGYAFKLSVSSTPGFNTKAEVAKYPANRINNYTTVNGIEYVMWDAIPVRCVREK